MDYTAAARVAQLVGTLTDKSSTTLDSSKLNELKHMLKADEELIAYAQPLIMDRLAANHSQVRKLALELCDMLFARSKRFRRLLTNKFTDFAELTVGHKQDKPLPAPPSAALALRQRALETVEKWHEQWGLHYPQVTVAYRYLKKQYKFPDISSRAAAAAAAEAARQQRHQQMLLQRYQMFCHDFSKQRQQLELLLKQLQECFDLLEQPVNQQPQQQQREQSKQPFQEQQQQKAQHSGSLAGAVGQTAQQDISNSSRQNGSANIDDQDWEDVAQAPAALAVKGDDQSVAAAAVAGGLAELDTGQPPCPSEEEQQQVVHRSPIVDWDDDFDADELVGEIQAPQQSDLELAARIATVLEQLSDLVKQAHLATSHQLLEWLRLLTQVQPPGQQQQQERQQHLRLVVGLRAQLQAQIEEAAKWGVVVGRSSAARQRQQQQQATQQCTGGSIKAGAQALKIAGEYTAANNGSQHQTDFDGSNGALVDLPSRSQQPLQLGHGSPSAKQCCNSSNITLGNGLLRLQRQAQHQPQQEATQQSTAVVVAGSRAGRSLQAQSQQQHRQPGSRHNNDPYANIRDPTAAVSGTYIIPKEVVQRNEQRRWWAVTDELPPDAIEPVQAGAAGTGNATAAAGSARANHTNTGTTANVPGPPPPVAAAAASSSKGGKEQAKGISSSKSLDSEVKKRLLAAAPQISVSGDAWLRAQHAVNSHGMELYNHWGAVDATAGIAKDRLHELVGYAASYYVPNKKLKTAAGVPTPADQSNKATDANVTAALPAAEAPAPAAAIATALEQPLQQGNPDRPSNVANPAGQLTATASPKQVQRTRTHRHEASAHNRAVLAGAMTDTALAASLQGQITASAEQQVQGTGRNGRAKPKETKASKLRKKLFG